MNNKKLAAVLIAVAVIFVIGFVAGSAAGKRHNTPEEDLPEVVTSPAVSLEVVTEGGTEAAEPETEEATEAQEQTTKPAKTTAAQEKTTKAAKTTKAPKATKAAKTQKPTEEYVIDTTTEAVTESWTDWDDSSYVEYHFRSKKLLNQHWEKHGGEFKNDFGYADATEYEKGASDVINNPEALNKTEAEDGDYIYYIEATNEFVVLSKDGYIRTYFRPNAGKKYYDRQ
ncbi:MAG: hypothetical protein J5501_01165 [Ruminococcus sp.]|nr:hypothetical protein [Ruminococcus sp.]